MSLPYLASTSLLILPTGANNDTDTTNSSQFNPWFPYQRNIDYTFSGNAKVSTTLGHNALYLDGNGDYITADWQFLCNVNDEDFTLGMRCYHTAWGGGSGDSGGFFMDTRSTGAAADGFAFSTSNAGVPRLSSSGLLMNADGALSLNTEHHVEICRSSGTWMMFVDGVKQSGTSTTVRYLTSSRVTIGTTIDGRAANTYLKINGYLWDMYFIRGFAWHTATFTPPASGLSDDIFAGQFIGDIEESLNISKWRITAHRVEDGLTAGTTTSESTSYTIPVVDIVPCTITCAPHIDKAWKTGYTPALDDLWVPSDPETTPYLFKCTTSGAVGGTEPTWNTTISSTTNDGSAVWTCISPLVDPISIGPKIPT